MLLWRMREWKIFQFFYLKLPNVFSALLLLGKYFCVRLPSPSPTPSFFSYSCVLMNTKCLPILRELYLSLDWCFLPLRFYLCKSKNVQLTGTPHCFWLLPSCTCPVSSCLLFPCALSFMLLQFFFSTGCLKQRAPTWRINSFWMGEEPSH